MAKSMRTPDPHNCMCLLNILYQNHVHLYGAGLLFSLDLEHGCGNWCSLSNKRIGEVRHRFWLRRPGVQSEFQLIPKVSSGFEVRALHKTMGVLPSKHCQSTHGAFWVLSYWNVWVRVIKIITLQHIKTCRQLFGPNFVATVWGSPTHTGVMATCPHTVGHIVQYLRIVTKSTLSQVFSSSVHDYQGPYFLLLLLKQYNKRTTCNKNLHMK